MSIKPILCLGLPLLLCVTQQKGREFAGLYGVSPGFVSFSDSNPRSVYVRFFGDTMKVSVLTFGGDIADAEYLISDDGDVRELYGPRTYRMSFNDHRVRVKDIEGNTFILYKDKE